MNSIDQAGTFRLGGRNVKRLGYGAMQLAGPGVFGPPKDRDAALAVLREAVASGVDHIDTSDFYGPHVTNALIREALAPYPDNLTLVTKVGARRDSKGAWLPAFSREDLTSAVHDNLRNLGLDVLEVVNLRSMFGTHGPAEKSIEEPLTVLAELQRQGLIRHIGLSNVTPTQIAEGRGICEIACVQNQYNLAHRTDDALIDELRRDRLRAVFPARRFQPAAILGAVRGGGAPRRHAHAGCACLAAAPVAQHLADPGHLIPCTPAGQPRRGRAPLAGRHDARTERDRGRNSGGLAERSRLAVKASAPPREFSSFGCPKSPPAKT